MSNFTTSFQYSTVVLARTPSQERKKRTIIRTINIFNKVANITLQISVPFVYTNNKLVNKDIAKTVKFVIVLKRIK